MRVPVHISQGNMVIERVLPKHAPISFITPELADRTKAICRSPVGLVIPPVDIALNAHGAHGAPAQVDEAAAPQYLAERRTLD